MSLGIYDLSKNNNPLSWDAVRAGIERRSNQNFEKHAAKFYRSGGKKKGLLKQIFSAIGRTEQDKPKKTMQRPGFLSEAPLIETTPEQKQLAKYGIYVVVALVLWMALGAPGA